jgi:hypothetical protein
MKKLLFILLLLLQISILYSQNLSDTLTVNQTEGAAGDDPSQFFMFIILLPQILIMTILGLATFQSGCWAISSFNRRNQP